MTSPTAASVGITIEDLHLTFGKTDVLKGVNLTIRPGEFFAFLGPSGSGKSTLLRSIAGFGPTPRGRILIGDQDVIPLQPWQRHVGMVFQSYALWPHLTVRQNVAFGLEERRMPKALIGDKVDQALDLVGLRHLADRRPSQLSGGQQQRIALARTVVVEPRVLLLDEPLSNLDANLRVQMRRDIHRLQRKLGLTTIFVTHDQEEANTTSDRIALLDQGVIQQIGTPMDLYDRPANRFVASFLGTANILDGQVSGGIFHSTGGLSLPLPADMVGPRSGTAHLVLRPQHLNVVPAQNAPLTAIVREREFLGATLRYGLETQGHTLIVDAVHRAGSAMVEEGATVGLSLSLDQAVLIGA